MSGKVGARLFDLNKKKAAAMIMRRLTVSLLAVVAWIVMADAAAAHHSFSMFDNEHPIVLKGVLREFKFTSPHTILVITVKNADGGTTNWNLEGENTGTLLRAGWTRNSIKPGDELTMTVKPLQSGAPAGSWDITKIAFSNGQVIAKPISVKPNSEKPTPDKSNPDQPIP